MMLHPNAERLLQFADGVTPESEHARLTSHLADCARCRAEVSGIREVQELLVVALEPAPEPLLARVYDSRALNALVMLPVTAAVDLPFRRSWRPWILLGSGIAAAAALWLVPFPSLSPSVAPRGAITAATAATTAFPANGSIDPSRIHPVTLWYEVENHRSYPPNSPPRFAGYRVRIEPWRADSSLWLVLTDGGDSRYLNRDSLFLRRHDLSVVRYKSLSLRHGHPALWMEYAIAPSELTVSSSEGQFWTQNAPRPSGPSRLTIPLQSPIPGPIVLGTGGEVVFLMALRLTDNTTTWRTRNFGGFSLTPLPSAASMLRTSTFVTAGSTGGGIFRREKHYTIVKHPSNGPDEIRLTIRESDGVVTRIFYPSQSGDSTVARLTSSQ